jgi:hypothetical protein
MSGVHARISANWMSTKPNDMRDIAFVVGDRFVKSVQSGRSSSIQICTVTRVEDGKVYADNSPRAINYPGRCLIVNEQFPVEA